MVVGEEMASCPPVLIPPGLLSAQALGSRGGVILIPHPSSLRIRNPGLKNAKTQHKSSVPLLAMECHPPPHPAGVPEGLEVGQEGVRCRDEGLVS